MVIKNSGIARIPFLKIKQIGICGGPYHESHFCQAWKR